MRRPTLRAISEFVMERTEILSRAEVSKVLQGLTRRAKRSSSASQNLVIFSAVTGCGLRVSELCGLNVGDLVTSGARPCIYVRKEIAKGTKARVIPLDWDAGTLVRLCAWKTARLSEGAQPDDPFIVCQRFPRQNQRMNRFRAWQRFRTCLKDLGDERLTQLSIHSGRHTFCSHALMAGRTLVEVRDAAGHSSVGTTNIYLHCLENTTAKDLYPQTGDDDGSVR